MHLLEAASSEASLRVFLLMETTKWIELGRNARSIAKHLEPLLGSYDRWGFDDLDMPVLAPTTMELPLVQKSWAAHKQGSPFDEVLATAMGDLTDDRLEFLRLYLFVDDAEWLARVRELDRFRRMLSGSPGPFPDELMDKVSWALQGPESTSSRTGLPSDWRSVSIMNAPESDARARTTLREIRGEIETYVRSILDQDRLTTTTTDETAAAGSAGSVADLGNDRVGHPFDQSNGLVDTTGEPDDRLKARS